MAGMPSMATCSRCARDFHVRSQMTLTDGRTIPMLVVPSQVDSVEAALAGVVCQVCLERQGPPERGLHAVLKSLGLEDTPARPIAVAMASPPARTPSIAARVVIAPARPGAPSLTSVTIVTNTTRGGSRTGGQGSRSDNRPAVKLPPAAPLRGKIGKSGDNAAVLQAAKATLERREAETRQREAERRAHEREERQRCFDRTVKVLRLLLLRTRKRAPSQDIDERIVTLDRKLRRAAGLDSQQRDKLALMELVGTSVEELVYLSHLVYLTMSVDPYGSKDFGCEYTRFVPRTPGPRLLKKRRAERAMTDAFPGGRRPESWDSRGGTRPGFYEFEYTGSLRELPIITNPPLPGGGNDPGVVNPQGGELGGMYETPRSRREALAAFPWDEHPQGWAACAFTSWLGDRHQEQKFVCNGQTVDVGAVMALFMEDIVLGTDETADDESEPDGTHVSRPDLPAMT